MLRNICSKKFIIAILSKHSLDYLAKMCILTDLLNINLQCIYTYFLTYQKSINAWKFQAMSIMGQTQCQIFILQCHMLFHILHPHSIFPVLNLEANSVGDCLLRYILDPQTNENECLVFFWWKLPFLAIEGYK